MKEPKLLNERLTALSSKKNFFLWWYIGKLSVKGGKVAIGKIQCWKKRNVSENPSRVCDRLKEDKILIVSKQKEERNVVQEVFLKIRENRNEHLTATTKESKYTAVYISCKR